MPQQSDPVSIRNWGLREYDLDGTLLWSSTVPPATPYFCAPTSFTLDPEGNWWVMDGASSFGSGCPRPRIVQVAPDGRELAAWQVGYAGFARRYAAGLA